MNDETFRRELSLALGEPPAAPAGEFSRIITLAQGIRRPGLFFPATACAAAMVFAVVTTAVVKPHGPGVNSVDIDSPSDESLDPYEGLLEALKNR